MKLTRGENQEEKTRKPRLKLPPNPYPKAEGQIGGWSYSVIEGYKQQIKELNPHLRVKE